MRRWVRDEGTAYLAPSVRENLVTDAATKVATTEATNFPDKQRLQTNALLVDDHAMPDWMYRRLRSEYRHLSSDSTSQPDDQAATNKALKAESVSLTGSARVLLFWSTIVMA
jgi:hypothetical protein